MLSLTNAAIMNTLTTQCWWKDQMAKETMGDQSVFICQGLENEIASILDSLFKAESISVGHGGALVESIAFNRRVVGSTPALAAM